MTSSDFWNTVASTTGAFITGSIPLWEILLGLLFSVFVIIMLIYGVRTSVVILGKGRRSH